MPNLRSKNLHRTQLLHFLGISCITRRDILISRIRYQSNRCVTKLVLFTRKSLFLFATWKLWWNPQRFKHEGCDLWRPYWCDVISYSREKNQSKQYVYRKQLEFLLACQQHHNKFVMATPTWLNCLIADARSSSSSEISDFEVCFHESIILQIIDSRIHDD